MKVWLYVLVYGLFSYGCASLVGLVAQAKGKASEPVFYMVLFISILVLGIIANGLAIIRKAFEIWTHIN